MINAEKFKKEIRAMTDESTTFAFKADDPTVIRKCNELDCHECLFNCGKCFPERMRWIVSEYKEPIKLAKLEYDILKYISDNTKHMYIVRDSDGRIFLYDVEPKKSKSGPWWVGRDVHGMVMFNKLFQFVQWEDSTPTPIKDILKNCEVVEDDD